MKAQMQLHPIRLKLKEPFRISRGEYQYREAVIIELKKGEISGYGEASEHSYYGVDISSIIQKAEKLTSKIEDTDWETPEDLWLSLKEILSRDHFLLAAIDEAAHDLYGKLKQLPSYKLWGLNPAKLPKSSYTISIDELDKMVDKIKAHSFDVYKIKLGTSQDLEIISTLRQHTDATFRVDANCAWDVPTTLYYAEKFKQLGVEFIEQPLPADDWEGMKAVFKKASLPVMADESCVNIEDVESCAACFHGINIKLMKCGGLTPALKMIKKARQLELKVMCGCMVESSVGISAAAQLLPLLDFADMDGPLFLANDPASGVKILEDGQIILPQKDGLGIECWSDAESTHTTGHA